MNYDASAKKIIDQIFKDLFGVECPVSYDQIKNKLAKNIALPEKTTCDITKAETWIYDRQPGQKIISQEAFADIAKKNDGMRPKQPLNNIDDVLKAWQDTNFMTAEKAINSSDVYASDSINSSSQVYESTLIISSKNIVLSHNVLFSNYLLASRGDNSCNFGIGLYDSLYCSSSYEVRWSNKVSKSMFINDCLDMYECMFCSNLRSKKYCIGNMQYEKEEYFQVKKIVIDWILDSLKK